MHPVLLGSHIGATDTSGRYTFNNRAGEWKPLVKVGRYIPGGRAKHISNVVIRLIANLEILKSRSEDSGHGGSFLGSSLRCSRAQIQAVNTTPAGSFKKGA